jgi:hypothetical protein
LTPSGGVAARRTWYEMLVVFEFRGLAWSYLIRNFVHF